MGYVNTNKLNHLLTNWPNGTVTVSSWLKDQGYSNPLLSKYKKSSWMESLGHDANVRPNDKVNWTGGLYAIQEQLHLPIHAGGKTALQLHGYAHFLPIGKGVTVTLFGPTGVKLPSWFLQHDWQVKVHYTMTKIFPAGDLGLVRKEMGSFSIKVSSPERAMMEVLHLVPLKESYDEAKLLMEGLTTLRPTLVQDLLEECGSIKVKRLFMHLAEELNLPWAKKLDIKKVNFGKGKRVIRKGGHFDPKYNISIPGPRLEQSVPKEIV
ncbi:MAG: hypothetical protein A3I11_07260 [Elusimicrobia bacterium RIFCSPLOWO2_02_FULL_39_32]|nr:MAG: hypothetical protein A2034_01645 [Elusimicrobia bacterium GWA2_38_7]OGR81449.1 MAG: hypothetical protein A3B80_05365 [Elusimicrobia bacterium RIFCSPHIGHO2_02_FULL_39_36]OGR91983.1 MAG: hypothetical protein A3I11_07260 [Elusimicrobia bacterium RIFCSPLOWO2_02_FULL_39_32]OGR98725.1 MAG: hypothetical protein A3G85_05170 [Elusimicrobia bacterium RIFCSPLOWO2_12_FULL_39_28]